jgi:hypothetical protein
MVFINLVLPFFERFIGNDSFRIYLPAQLITFCTPYVGKIRVIQIPIPVYVNEASKYSTCMF